MEANWRRRALTIRVGASLMFQTKHKPQMSSQTHLILLRRIAFVRMQIVIRDGRGDQNVGDEPSR
jgi:hypothetical protein